MRNMLKVLMSLSMILLVAGFVFIGCSEEDDTVGPTEGTGTVNLTLTDAVFPFDLVAEANVTIDSVTIHRAGDDEGEWFTIANETMQFNLLDFQNGVTTTLGSVELETGTYNQIRMYVSDASVVLTDASEFELTVPSGSESGLKINIQPQLALNADVTSEVLLDFDVSKSFTAQGNISSPSGINGFHFKPVVRATNRSETGTISGTVTDTSGTVLENVQVEILDADSVLTSAATDASGEYTVIGIPEGTYTVSATAGDSLAATEADVVVTTGATTTVDLVVTDGGGDATETGTLTVTMTDAPFPFELLLEANVTIDRVEVKMVNMETDTTDSFIVLDETERQLNLLDLQGGVTATLANFDVPAGDYSQVRLHVVDANVLLVDSTEFELTIPSGSQTGIKVNIQPALTVPEEGDAEILLDFDVSKSFVVQGNANTPAGIHGFHFKPTLRAVNRAATGTLSGVVTDTSDVGLFGATISVATVDSVITAASTDSLGQYMILGLLPGDYDVTAGLEGYDDSDAASVTIVAGDESTANFELIETAE